MPLLAPALKWSVAMLLIVAGRLVVAGAEAANRSTDSSAEGLAFFESKIRPLLVERCYECHSAESKKLKGGLRLDSREGVLKGGDSGPAIVPGKPENSLLIKAVRYIDPDLQMPPHHQLSAGQIADLEQWVRMGAPDSRQGDKPVSTGVDIVQG